MRAIRIRVGVLYKGWRAMAARVIGLCLAVVLLTLSVAPDAAWAHVRSTTGFSEIRQEGKAVSYDLSLEYEMLVAATGLGEEALEATSNEDRRAVLKESEQRIASYLRPNLRLFLDGVECEGVIDKTGIEQRQGVAYATVLLSYECPGSASGTYEVSYGVFADSIVDEHSNVADYRLGGEEGRFVFDNSHRELTVGEAGPLSSAASFVALGVEHILGGIDHVLFVAALLLGARSLMSVVKVATAFTVAHSVTLALAAIGWVNVPPDIVEPLIALSIAYVAAENIIGGESRHRILVVFGFGLLHGLGFASAMSFTDEISWRLLSSLLTFNIGIELGQGLIILLVFPLLLLIRRLKWSRFAHVGVTGVIGAFGLFWFFERLLT